VTCRMAYEQDQADERKRLAFAEWIARAEKAEAELAEAKALLKEVFAQDCETCEMRDEDACLMGPTPLSARAESGRRADCPYLPWEGK
jgi:hypothetical protein